MKKKIYITALISMLILLTSNQRTLAEKYSVYTPTTYKQVQIVQSPKRANIEGEAVELLVDYSASMIRWLNQTAMMLQYILPKIPQTTSVALRVFGEPPIGDYSYMQSCKATRLVAYFKKENQVNILNGLQKSVYGGNTPLEFALRETVEKDFRNLKIVSSDGKNVSQRKKIILITDGADSCGGNPCAYIKQLMKTRNDIQIDVIQMGSDTSIRCLSNETGGTFNITYGDIKKLEMALEDAFEVPRGTVENARSGKNSIKIQNSNQSQIQINPQNQQQENSNKNRGYKFIKF